MPFKLIRYVVQAYTLFVYKPSVLNFTCQCLEYSSRRYSDHDVKSLHWFVTVSQVADDWQLLVWSKMANLPLLSSHQPSNFLRLLFHFLHVRWLRSASRAGERVYLYRSYLLGAIQHVIPLEGCRFHPHAPQLCLGRAAAPAMSRVWWHHCCFCVSRCGRCCTPNCWAVHVKR